MYGVNRSGENNPFHGKHHTLKWRKEHSGENHPLFGKHLPLRVKEKMSENAYWRGKSGPFLGRTGEKHPMFGRRGKDAPMFGRSPSFRIKRKISKFQKELWKNPEHARKVFAHRSPNNKELEVFSIIDSVTPKDFKFVGNGQFVLGGKCPDFMNVNGKKLLIEFNSEYWHRGENTRTRARHFAKYGFKTLFIWQRELKNTERLKRKILKFVGADKVPLRIGN